MEKKLISIIIPAYNEEFRIGKTLLEISEYIKGSNFDFELIVIDDGSKDRTIDILKEKKSLFNNFLIIENVKNRGKGFSVKKGMLSARGEYRLFMDADSSVKISNLDLFLEEIKKGNDIVIGSIELQGSKNSDDNYFYRRIFGKISKFIIRHIATPGIYDTQRGFKLFTKEASLSIFPKLTIDRWGFDIEIIAIAQEKGLKIKEIPVEWINSKASSVNLLSYPKTFIELIKIKTNSLLGLYK